MIWTKPKTKGINKMTDRIDAINKAIGQIIDDNVEYATTHIDSGDGYAHMPREGSWCFHNGDDRLKEFIEANEIDTYDLDNDALTELVLDNFEMVSGHIFSTVNAAVFNVASYPVVEVETQIEFSTLSEITGLNITKKRMQAIKEHSTEHCIGSVDNDSFLAYQTTDCVWLAQMTADALVELINDSVEE